MAMRDKKRREGIKNVDKREKVRLFTKKRKVSQKDGKEDKRRGSERKILNHKNRKIIVKSNKSIKNRKCAAWSVK